MFFGDFEVWKLHSFSQYAFFIIYVAIVAAVIFYAIKKINSGRNDESAVKRVAKRFKKYKNGKVYNDITLDIGGEQLHYDHLIVDAAGLVAIRTIGRGLKIYGEPDSDTWKVTDNKEPDKRIPNPIKELEGSFEKLRKYLTSNGAYRVNIDPLVIFADPFAPPELYLGRDSHCIIFDGVKIWAKNRMLRADGRNNKPDALNVADISAALEKAAVKK